MDAIQLELCKDLEHISQRKKKQNIILFFGRDTFSDNSKYLYLYMQAHCKAFQVIWCSTCAPLIQQLRQHDLPCFLMTEDEKATHSLFLEAAIAVFCINPLEVTRGNLTPLACLKGAMSLQLWHGVGLKRLDLALTAHMDVANIVQSKSLAMVSSSDYYLSPSKIVDVGWHEFFGARRLLRAGYPRNEVLLREATPHEMIGSALHPTVEQGLYHSPNKKILLAPTHEKNAGLNNKDMLAAILVYCKQRNINVFVKRHPFVQPKGEVESQIGNLFNIPSGLDIYPHLKQFDALVTDYSSIVFDYLLVDKPVISVEAKDNARFGYSLVPGGDSFSYMFNIENLPTVFDTALGNDHKSTERKTLKNIMFSSNNQHANEEITQKILAAWKKRESNAYKIELV